MVIFKDLSMFVYIRGAIPYKEIVTFSSVQSSSGYNLKDF